MIIALCYLLSVLVSVSVWPPCVDAINSRKRECLGSCRCIYVSTGGGNLTEDMDKIWIHCNKEIEIIGDLNTLLEKYPRLTYLNITGYPSKSLPQSICRMRFMKILSFTSSNLRSQGIPRHCFRQLPQLEYLNLYDNIIKFIFTDMFSGLVNLAYLDFKHNIISTIPADFGKVNLPRLTFISFRSNQLDHIDSWPLELIFRRDTEEKLVVNLEYNKINNLSDSGGWRQYAKLDGQQLLGEIDFWSNSLTYLRDIFYGWNLPPAERDRLQPVVTIDICGNEFTCDCVDAQWRKFFHFDVTKTLPIGFHENVEYVECNKPESHLNVLAINIPEEDFVCNVYSDCPEGCTCSEIPVYKALEVDCSHGRNSKRLLKTLPEKLPPPKSKSLISGNFTYMLKLSGNDISTLDYRYYLSSTSHLDISDNHLENITLEAFENLGNVKSLYLDGNFLSSLPKGIADIKFNIAPEITLHGNKWRCGCEYLESWKFIINHLKSISDSDRIICTEYSKGFDTFKVESLFSVENKLNKCDGERDDLTKRVDASIIIIVILVILGLFLMIALVFFRRQIKNFLSTCKIQIVSSFNSQKDNHGIVNQRDSRLSNEMEAVNGIQVQHANTALPYNDKIEESPGTPPIKSGECIESKTVSVEQEHQLYSSAPSDTIQNDDGPTGIGQHMNDTGETEGDGSDGASALPPEISVTEYGLISEQETIQIQSLAECPSVKSKNSFNPIRKGHDPCRKEFGAEAASGSDQTQPFYDAFFSFSSEEDDYICENIIEKLEELGYKIHFSRRDFTPGNHILENIVDAVASSARTVFYCSRKFLNSNFCRWEVQYVADQQARSNKTPFVIIKSKHFVDEYAGEFTDLMQELKIGMFTYIEEDGPYFWQQFIKAVPKRTH